MEKQPIRQVSGLGKHSVVTFGSMLVIVPILNSLTVATDQWKSIRWS